MAGFTEEHRIGVIKQAIARGDAEVRSDCTVFVHMRAGAAQHHATALSGGNYEPEGPGAVFVLPKSIVNELAERAAEAEQQICSARNDL